MLMRAQGRTNQSDSCLQLELVFVKAEGVKVTRLGGLIISFCSWVGSKIITFITGLGPGSRGYGPEGTGRARACSLYFARGFR